MESKIKFTQTLVRDLPPPKKSSKMGYLLYRDTVTDNLAVRVTMAGTRSYVYEARGNGRKFRLTIGNVKAWKLDAARVEARRLATVVDNKKDPRDEAAAELAKAAAQRVEAQRHTHIVAGVWAAYIEVNQANWGERHLADHISLAHPGGAEKKRGVGRTIPGPLAALMPLKLSELDSSRIKSWLENETDKKRKPKPRPTSAAGAYRLLRAFVRWTHDYKKDGEYIYRGIVPVDACSAKEVRDLVPSSKAKKDDCLQKGQLAAWFAAVKGLRNPVISAFLQSLLLTGARREELGRLKWDDLDFTWHSLDLRDKVEGTRKIPLTPYVASLLNALPRRNEWVFSSTAGSFSNDATKRKGRRLVEPTKAHIDALERAGIPHVTLHGLRRSFRTLSGWVDLPVGVVAQIMGHKPSAIAEKHYEDRPHDMLLEKHIKLESWIIEQAGIT